MMIAACYVSSEGVVLGADSTSTVFVSGPTRDVPGTTRHLNYAQKLFKIGQDSTLGLAMWGMGAINGVSHRTVIAKFADSMKTELPQSVEQAAQDFSESFWSEYSNRLSKSMTRIKELKGLEKPTEKELHELNFWIEILSGGFCIGGHTGRNREPQAFEIIYRPDLEKAPQSNLLPFGGYFWGCPNITERVIFGIDNPLLRAILASEKWSGTSDELLELVAPGRLAQPSDLPLREAVDWVHAGIYTTIKAMKFSHNMPICGGPIEIAVISSDRNFRWVKHKRFDEALFDLEAGG